MGTEAKLAEFLVLLRREWREDWVFLLVAGVLLAVGGGMEPPFSFPKLMPILLAVAAGLVLGVRAYAPDSANGTARFIQALPVAGRTVLAAKLLWRGLAIGLAMLVAPSTTLLGATVLVACLVGMVTGWLLEQPTTAFAAGAAALVVLVQAGLGAIPHTLAEAGFRDWCVLAAGLAGVGLALLGTLRWLVGRQ